MKVSFDIEACSDFNEWAKENKKIHQKIIELIKDISRNPFDGIGKPEPLRANLSGYWSRRITDEHRLVYRVENGEIFVLSCKFHY